MSPSEKGTPQGGVLSPMLANIGLHSLDVYWAKRRPQTELVRYGDEFVVLIRGRNPGSYLENLKRFFESVEIKDLSKNTV